jgi:hypothetical protein
MSDVTGHRLSLSLKNNVRAQSENIDLMIVPSLEGVFIANIFDVKYLDLLKTEIQFNNSAPGNIDGNIVSNLGLLEHYKQTKITFDNGGRWDFLRAPRFDSFGKAIKCEDDCYLHLHVYSTDSHSPVYSIDSGMGLIIGVGNVGSHLSVKQETNTYISR